ncbi:MAG: zinc-binding dehydrogenase [Chloroflexota bacterium]|nr:zinc-binding dehydrogenase [Chloroflexota bacterium]
MKAVIFERHGGPDVLEYRDVPEPTVAPDGALVRVRACGLNHLDLFTREGRLPHAIALPHISGSEVAGDVERVGELVTNITPGERVVIAPYLVCGRCENCLAGEETTCLRGDVLGRRSDGGYAEYVSVPARQLIALPEGVSYEAGAAVTLSTVTAWHMLVSRARLRPGEDVLVLAAGSGVGSAAVQIAKQAGARVIATASTDEKLRRAEQLGADFVVNYAEQDFRAEVRRITAKRGVDVVVEHVGESTWEQSIGCLARNGRLVTTGATTGPNGAINIDRLFGAQLSILGSFGGTRSELRMVLKMVAEGRIQPVIHATYPLDQAAQAQRLMEERGQFGKLLLLP